MWTNISLNTHLVWETVLWTVTAVWLEDEDAEPVAIQQTGTAALRDSDDPEAILTVALGSFLARNGLPSPTLRD